MTFGLLFKISFLFSSRPLERYNFLQLFIFLTFKHCVKPKLNRTGFIVVVEISFLNSSWILLNTELSAGTYTADTGLRPLKENWDGGE